jgi:hypothetical protein
VRLKSATHVFLKRKRNKVVFPIVLRDPLISGRYHSNAEEVIGPSEEGRLISQVTPTRLISDHNPIIPGRLSRIFLGKVLEFTIPRPDMDKASGAIPCSEALEKLLRKHERWLQKKLGAFWIVPFRCADGTWLSIRGHDTNIKTHTQTCIQHSTAEVSGNSEIRLHLLKLPGFLPLWSRFDVITLLWPDEIRS